MGSNRNSSNIIDINGKRYDATTGAHLGSSPVVPAKPVVHGVRSGQPKSIDGFSAGSRSQALAAKKPVHVPTPQYVAAPRQIHHQAHRAVTAQPTHHTQPATTTHASQRAVHKPGVTATAHTPQRATTLMRSSVTKPVIKAPSTIKAHTRTDLVASAHLKPIKPKMSYNSINPVRHKRAERMIQSSAISRYGTAEASATVYKVSQPTQPAARPLPHYKGSPAPRMDGFARLPARSATQTPASPVATASSRPAAQPKPSDALFVKALADAKSHEQVYDGNVKRKTKKRGHWLRYVGASVVILLLIGFLAYKNAPSISLHVASYRAGLNAKMPSQEPSGYSYGDLNYQPGNVTVNFTSAQNGQQFSIAQKTSNWDSQALLSNFVSTASSAYKTYQQAGRTVYVLSNNTATWVDSGIWYTVNGNASLSAKQLLDLAGSM